jgi:hypothetical protein
MIDQILLFLRGLGYTPKHIFDNINGLLPDGRAAARTLVFLMYHDLDPPLLQGWYCSTVPGALDPDDNLVLLMQEALNRPVYDIVVKGYRSLSLIRKDELYDRYAPLTCADEDGGGVTDLCPFASPPEIIVNYDRESPRRAGDTIKVDVRGVNQDGSTAPLTVVELVNCDVVVQDAISITLRINDDEPMVPNIKNISFTVETVNCAGSEAYKVNLCTYNPLVSHNPVGLNNKEGVLPATICVYDEVGRSRQSYKYSY